MNDMLYDIAFSFDQSITPIEKVQLFTKFGSSYEILSLRKNMIKSILGRGWTGENFNKESLLQKARIAFEYIAKANVRVIRFDHKLYPYGLKEIPDFPFLLYCKGNPEYAFDRSLAIVGTRKPDAFGIKRVKDFTKYLSGKGMTIISGLASGIDTLSHIECLNQKGKTIAVLGCGIDTVYPYINKQLAREILQKNGAIISEYPPGIKPLRWNFPKRNRIIVGLSASVLIIQAPERSGSLISAYLASDYNRELYVINPGKQYKPIDMGNNILINLGANSTSKPEQIISFISD